MTILSDQSDRAVVEGRQDHSAAWMMDHLADVSAIGFANGVDRNIEHSAAKYSFRVDEFRCVSHRLGSLVSNFARSNGRHLRFKNFLHLANQI
jgi:hypothetical protein